MCIVKKVSFSKAVDRMTVIFDKQSITRRGAHVFYFHDSDLFAVINDSRNGLQIAANLISGTRPNYQGYYSSVGKAWTRGEIEAELNDILEIERKS